MRRRGVRSQVISGTKSQVHRLPLDSGAGGSAAPFDFVVETLSGTTGWGVSVISAIQLIGIDISDFEIELIEGLDAVGDEAGLAVVSG